MKKDSKLRWTQEQLANHYAKKGKVAPVAKKGTKKTDTGIYDSKLEEAYARRLSALKKVNIIADYLRIVKPKKGETSQFTFAVCGWHKYTPDFWIELLSGQQIIVELKGFERRYDKLTFDDAAYRNLQYGWIYLAGSIDKLTLKLARNITKKDLPKELI